MGANTFFDVAYGKTAKEAFNEVHQAACWEYGQNSYTGTIAEKYDFTVIPFDTDGEITAEEYAYILIDREDPRIDDKWGPAGCLEIRSDRDGLRKFLFFGWASS